MNTHVRDQFIDLDRRTSPTQNPQPLTGTTTSTTYGNVSNAGPALANVAIGSTGLCMITWSSLVVTDTAGNGGWMSVELAGTNAYALAPNDNYAINYTPGSASVGAMFGISIIFSGITPGSLNITSKYRVQAAGATGSFTFRFLQAQPLGS